MNPVTRLWDRLRLRRQAYLHVFTETGVAGDRVLSDLARFCRANETTFHENDRAATLLEGRREVWLRIQHHLQLDDATMWTLYDGRPIGDLDG
jgi:hypothetical protein